MKFSRLATADDFEKCDIDIGNYREMDYETKMFIEQENMYHAIESLRRRCGMGIVTAKGYCEQYATFLQAKKDFEEGKAVYVNY